MKITKMIYILGLLLVLGFAGCDMGKTSESGKITLDPALMPKIGTVDERFQSYNVEMAEVIGGNFWKPYDKQNKKTDSSEPDTAKFEVGAANTSMFQKMEPIDLYNTRLRKLASALGPAYMRVSGTWANTVYFQDNDAPAMETPPEGFKGVLTRAQWKGVIDFSEAVDAKLMTSFAISAGVRNDAGIWMPVEAQKIASYTKSIGGKIAAAELFNEPNVAMMGGAPEGYDAQTYANDIAAFRNFAKTNLPDMLIVGPGSVGEGMHLMPESMPMLHTANLLSTEPKPQFDIFSYHYYGAVSQRCAAMSKDFTTSPDEAISEKWLAQSDTVLSFYKGLSDEYVPKKPIWVTETADAACGGNPWAITFLDCFRYLDQMGRLAKGGVSVIYHNTLSASEYGLLDQKTHLPRPHYWAALLWHQLMGTTVLDAGASSRPGLLVYAHNMRSHNGGVTILVINLNKEPASINIPMSAVQFTLTAPDLQDNRVLLNGKALKLGENDELPSLEGIPVKSGDIKLLQASINFFTIADAENPNDG